MIPSGALTLADDGRHATLAIRNLPVVDQPTWPAHDTATMPARISFRIEWTATDECATYRDAAKHFRFTGWRATAHLAAQVHVPAADFSWRSDPIETSNASFAIIGEEVNGRYFEA